METIELARLVQEQGCAGTETSLSAANDAESLCGADCSQSPPKALRSAARPNKIWTADLSYVPTQVVPIAAFNALPRTSATHLKSTMSPLV